MSNIHNKLNTCISSKCFFFVPPCTLSRPPSRFYHFSLPTLLYPSSPSQHFCILLLPPNTSVSFFSLPTLLYPSSPSQHFCILLLPPNTSVSFFSLPTLLYPSSPSQHFCILLLPPNTSVSFFSLPTLLYPSSPSQHFCILFFLQKTMFSSNYIMLFLFLKCTQLYASWLSTGNVMDVSLFPRKYFISLAPKGFARLFMCLCLCPRPYHPLTLDRFLWNFAWRFQYIMPRSRSRSPKTWKPLFDPLL